MGSGSNAQDIDLESLERFPVDTFDHLGQPHGDSVGEGLLFPRRPIGAREGILDEFLRALVVVGVLSVLASAQLFNASFTGGLEILNAALVGGHGPKPDFVFDSRPQ